MGFPSWVSTFFLCFSTRKEKRCFFSVKASIMVHTRKTETSEKRKKKFQSQIELVANYCANCCLIESQESDLFGRIKLMNLTPRTECQWTKLYSIMRRNCVSCNWISLSALDTQHFCFWRLSTTAAKTQNDTNRSTVCEHIFVLMREMENGEKFEQKSIERFIGEKLFPSFQLTFYCCCAINWSLKSFLRHFDICSYSVTSHSDGLISIYWVIRMLSISISLQSRVSSFVQGTRKKMRQRHHKWWCLNGTLLCLMGGKRMKRAAINGWKIFTTLLEGKKKLPIWFTLCVLKNTLALCKPVSLPASSRNNFLSFNMMSTFGTTWTPLEFAFFTR